MTRVFLGIGANIEPLRNIPAGLTRLAQALTILRLSPGYRSPAMGFDGPEFINLVAEVETSLTLAELNLCLKQIETEFGREADAAKFSSRALDIDILLFGDLTGAHQGIELPRPDVHQFAFVLRPLLDLIPDGVCPQTGQPFRAYLPRIQGQILEPCDLVWQPLLNVSG
ncbi:MAG TPA: 2-amino-4-hydroxy-6-hydroxymethyldihydropteridine diphosphokinase [Oceanospirillales bacterium]|nr:2-amino-4-hydroxy-6-hydroxymethyldihydropteridine diphosphokinase [Oceanospirillaceae bacterium]MAR01447.1 2-amino-4-hydroxy-6-hydroxymethyldihydropteridine diphosphokinase [Oceanospirillaceae bacterium]HBS42605.1 2-amino-4-hydroxy-6-hydroxymethyldihydropteridine diphosphokinase [Oceanospirillales bacterium]|tara:strand:+ start:436 stop:942 length:507 start_codon:yes stop_codon:yes gene_type:complete